MTEYRLVNPTGRDVEDGEVGELILRGETLMKGYWRNSKATAETVVDGWLHTGDLARRDTDGYVTLVDRLKDLIISGGRNVYSVEVENALTAHPHIAECAVVGRPHEEYGESIVAYYVVDGAQRLSPEALRDFCMERISRYKVPHDWVQVQSLPRNPSGKILKRNLRSTTA